MSASLIGPALSDRVSDRGGSQHGGLILWIGKDRGPEKVKNWKKEAGKVRDLIKK